MTATFELAEYGSDLSLRVWGESVPACLDAALHGFASHIAEIPPAAATDGVPIDIAGNPAELLVGILDEAIAALDIEGTLACGLGDVRVDDRRAHGSLIAVALRGLVLRGAPPKAATWHDARLEPTDRGWQGHVVLDL